MTTHQFWLLMDQVGGLAFFGALIWVGWLALARLSRKQ